MRPVTWMCVVMVETALCATSVNAQKPGQDGEEAGGCITSGSASLGTYFRTCTSSVGSVSQVTGQSGVTNIGSEGYAICAGTTHAVESGAVGDVGFNDPTTSTASSNVRTTTDGRFRLTQSFTRDALEKEIIITMTVRNQTASAIANVYVARFFDGDIAGTPEGDKYSATNRSVFAHQDYANGGLALSALTFNFAMQTAIVAFNNHAPLTDGCFTRNAVFPVTPTAAGDWVGWITYYLGTINASASKIVKFVYRVM